MMNHIISVLQAAHKTSGIQPHCSGEGAIRQVSVVHTLTQP